MNKFTKNSEETKTSTKVYIVLTTLRANNLISTSFQGIATFVENQPLKKSCKLKQEANDTRLKEHQIL